MAELADAKTLVGRLMGSTAARSGSGLPDFWWDGDDARHKFATNDAVSFGVPVGTTPQSRLAARQLASWQCAMSADPRDLVAALLRWRQSAKRGDTKSYADAAATDEAPAPRNASPA